MKNIFRKKPNILVTNPAEIEIWGPLVSESIKSEKLKQISYKMTIVYIVILCAAIIYLTFKRK